MTHASSTNASGVPAAPSALDARSRGLALVAFFVSGASSLIFQSIWGRRLHLVFGATGFATSTVVTAFMAGLGLGAFLAGKHGHRIRRPLLAYAAVEVGVGLWALFVPSLVDPEGFLATVNGFMRNELGATSWQFMFGRFLCVLPILLVPTTLMGASLPLLAQHFVRSDQSSRQVGAWVGALYSVNTLGAVVGNALSGFVLMPKLGLVATNLVAVGMNLALGGTIWLLRKRLAVEVPPPPAPDTDEGESPATTDTEDDFAVRVGPWSRRIAVISFGVSGAASLCNEVVWTRALAMTIGSSVYSFTLILVTFLVGIAGGSAIAAASFARGSRPIVGLAVASAFLTFVANGVRAVSDGATLWIALSFLFCVPIALLATGLVVRTRRNGPDAEAPIAPALLLLVVPMTAAIVNQALVTDRLRLLALFLTVAVECIAILVGLLTVLRRYPMLQLGVVQLGIAAATFANYVVQDEIPCGFASMVQALRSLYTTGTGQDFHLYQHVGTVQLLMLVTAALCILPSTVGMGAMFPLTLRVFTSGGRSVARDVGVVYASNTLGSIVGAWVPGFLLMPWIGTEMTLIVAVVLNLLLALVLVIAAASAEPRPTPDGKPTPLPAWHTVSVYVLAPLVPALVALLWIASMRESSPLRWDLGRMSMGVFRLSLSESGEDVCDPGQTAGLHLLFYEDGLSTTVSVEHWGEHIALKNNGKVDASNGDDMPTQIMVGAYPLLLHPRGPEGLDLAVIGFGSGVTVGTTLQFPVRRVDVIELERAIPAAARHFVDVNHLDFPLDRFPYVRMPRLEVVNDDGRNYLASTDRQYDVIISEPSNPWITGVSDLFTADHFRITKRRLRPGGIYCQWVQLYELSPENIKSIYRTFASQFRHVLVFAADDLSSDTILLGSDSPIPMDLQRLGRAFRHPDVPKELERAHVRSPYDLYARLLLGGRGEVEQYAQIEWRKEGGAWESFADSSNDPARSCTGRCRREPAGINTDDNMRIEFAAPRDLIGYDRYEGYLVNIYSPEWPFGRVVRQLQGFGEGDVAAARYADLGLVLLGHSRRVEAAELIERSGQVGRSERTRLAFEVFTLLVGRSGEPLVPIESPVPGPQLAARDARLLVEGFADVRAAVDQGRFEDAYDALQAIPAPVRRHSGPSLRLLEAWLSYKTAGAHPGAGAGHPSRYAHAAEELEAILTAYPDYVARHPEIHYFLARSYDGDLRADEAVASMRTYVEALDAARTAAAAAAVGSPGQPSPPVAPRGAQAPMR